MDPDFIWYPQGDGFGILELHERLTAPGPPLELHVVHDGDEGRTHAAWVTADEKWIGYVPAGEA